MADRVYVESFSRTHCDPRRAVSEAEKEANDLLSDLTVGEVRSVTSQTIYEPKASERDDPHYTHIITVVYAK